MATFYSHSAAVLADDERTGQLIDAWEAYTGEHDPDVQSPFAAVVMEGLCCTQCSCSDCVSVYPPPGHTYPAP